MSRHRLLEARNLVGKGKILFEAAGQSTMFVQYATENKEKIRQEFIKKKIKTVIATSTWKEGIDIPTLDVIIYAAGLKSEIST